MDRLWNPDWGDYTIPGAPPTSYAAALSGGFHVDSLGHSVFERALRARAAHRAAQSKYSLENPDVRAGAELRFSRLQARLLGSTTVDMHVYTHALLVKRPFAVVCVDNISFKSCEIR